jgi:outer membrane lipoprotein carrier protein
MWCSLAAAVDLDPAVSRLERRYRGVASLQANFLERYSETGKNTRIESGTVSFLRPGKMRWEYQSPEPKLFVSDGKTIWFYVPSDKTIMRASVKESSDWRVPFALLTRDPSMHKLCSSIAARAETGPPASGRVLLRCTPRDQSMGITEVLIAVDSKTGDIRQLVLRQPARVQIEFTFANWKLNLPLPESEFRFVAPTGVAIVEAPGSLAGPAN